jgi:hypothetical protein
MISAFSFTGDNNNLLPDLSITGEDDAIFSQRNAYQIFIVLVVEKCRIITD